METLSEHFAPFEKKETAAAASEKDPGKQPTILNLLLTVRGEISKGADSSQQPKQTLSLLTDPDHRTGKRKEMVAALVNRIMSSSSTGLTQLPVNANWDLNPLS